MLNVLLSTGEDGCKSEQPKKLSKLIPHLGHQRQCRRELLSLKVDSTGLLFHLANLHSLHFDRERSKGLTEALVGRIDTW